MGFHVVSHRTHDAKWAKRRKARHDARQKSIRTQLKHRWGFVPPMPPAHTGPTPRWVMFRAQRLQERRDWRLDRTLQALCGLPGVGPRNVRAFTRARQGRGFIHR